MKRMMITRIEAGCVLAAFVAFAAAVSSHAMYNVSDTGLWPTNWPKELEPLRKQSRTLRHDQYQVYEIPFTNQQQFEAAWPHILAVKNPEAPIILLKGPNERLGKTIKAGVRMLAPRTGDLVSPKGGHYPPSAEGIVTNIALLKIGPPWPDNVKSKSGALPEFVIYDNGRWVPYSVQDLKTNAPMYERSLMRARIEIELIVDGDLVDLNRVFLPADAPIIDKRFPRDSLTSAVGSPPKDLVEVKVTATELVGAPDRLAAELGNGIRVTVLDATGHKPIKEFQVISGVRSLAGGEKAKEVVNWQPHTLCQGRDGGLVWPLDRAYDEMALRVEADGYAPQVLAWLKKSQGPQNVVFELPADKGTTGRALTPDGLPAAGATVALAMVQRDVVIDNGVLWHADKPAPERPSDRWRWPRLVKADGQGRFQLPSESDPTAAVLIVHESGVRELALADFKKKPELALQPWGRIEGKVQWGNIVDSNRTVTLSIHRDTYGYPGVIVQSGKTTTAGDGTFVFERVLPGRAQISCPIAATPGNTSGISEVNLLAQSTHLRVEPGANRALLGGQGRTIRGRLVGSADWAGVTFHFHPTAPHIGLPGDDEMGKGWGALQKSPAGPLFFRKGLKVNPDGTFEIPAVLPGEYQIFFTRAGERAAGGKFVVPPETPGTKPDPQDIGEFRSQNGP